MTFNAEFHRPSSLSNPFPIWQKLIIDLHKKIGVDQLSSRLESVCYDWALESGYYFKKVGDRFIFVHVSLNPKDFN